MFHFLGRLPGPLKWWTRTGEAAFQRLLDVYGAEVIDLRERMKSGTCPRCFANEFLEDRRARSLVRQEAVRFGWSDGNWQRYEQDDSESDRCCCCD